LPELAYPPEAGILCWPALEPAVPMYDAKALLCSSFAMVLRGSAIVRARDCWRQARGRPVCDKEGGDVVQRRKTRVCEVLQAPLSKKWKKLYGAEQ